MHRGARREPIFRHDGHYRLFLCSLEEASHQFGLEVHAFSLMPNHFHLLVRTPHGNLSRGMRHVDSTYTQRMNLRHSWDGPLLRGRFRSQPIRDELHLDNVFAYIHLNPHQAHLATRLEDPCWTSLRVYLGLDRPLDWLRTAFFSERLGGPEGIVARLRGALSRTARWPEEMDPATGWLSHAPATPPAPASGLTEARAPAAEEVLARVARLLGVTLEVLRSGPRGKRAHPARHLAVWALSRAGVFSHREIGAALQMPPSQVAYLLWRLRRGCSPQLRAWQAALDRAAGLEFKDQKA